MPENNTAAPAAPTQAEPAPQPAPPTEKTLEKLRKWEQNGELIERAWKVLNDQENEIIRLERELAAAPKADHIEDDLAMAPAPPQQGEYPETLYEGGRESVDDALAVVESFGPGVQGLNDTFARQVLLGQEVRRLRAAYEHACQGRSDFRNLYRAARGAAQASPAPVAEDAEDGARFRAMVNAAFTGFDAFERIMHDAAAETEPETIDDFRALVDKARAQAAQPAGGANANR